MIDASAGKYDGKFLPDVIIAEVSAMWDKLESEARAVLHPRKVSDLVEAGGVAAAILTDRGNIYTGICIDIACSLGMCAERNAAANMLTHGESVISKVVCIDRDGKYLPPCGACREFLMALDRRNAETEFLFNHGQVVKLKELLPDWWGWKYCPERYPTGGEMQTPAV